VCADNLDPYSLGVIQIGRIKMNVLNAVKRIIWEDRQDSMLESSVELDAKFAKGREADLRKIQGFLRGHGMVFSLKDGALFHKTGGADIDWHVQEVIQLMNGFGCGLLVQQSTLRNRVWAMRGRGGITLQRLRSELRIFYSC
jgi:hypothetical protein